jgi:uncharacterized membrane protein (UPF0136 family)
MEMKHFGVWSSWLFILGLVIVALGLAMSLLGSTPAFNLVEPVFWGAQAQPAQALAFRGWIYGVTGATMAGWGVFVAFVALRAFARRERWAWYCTAIGVLVWYIPDTAMSLRFGVAINVVINSILLVGVALPLIFTRKAFREAAK